MLINIVIPKTLFNNDKNMYDGNYCCLIIINSYGKSY